MRAFGLTKLVLSCVCLVSLACSSAGTEGEDGAGGASPLGIGGSIGVAGSAGNVALAGSPSSAGSGAAGASGGAAGSEAAGGSSLAGTASGGAASGGAAGVGMAGMAGAAGGTQTGFRHPGVFVSKGMLDFVKGKLGAEPYKSALSKAQGDFRGKTSYKPTKTANVICFPISGSGSVGCAEEKDDANAAYIHALLWYYTGNQANAAKAIEIMDLYSSTLKTHSEDNKQLQSAWVASVFARAGEIIRYSNAGWPDAKAKQFGAMLTNAYMPYIKDFSTRTGNWDTSTIEAVIAIAVYNDDKVNFDRAVARWRVRAPAWSYLAKDGAQPISPPGGGTLSASAMKGLWDDPTKYVDGISQETCKDFPGGTTTGGMGHMQYGLAALINAAETARIQGVDLFKDEQQRLVTTLEFHAKYLNSLGTTPSSLCESGMNKLTIDPMWEVAYNAYANVLGQSLPESKKVVASQRASGKVLVDHHMVWEVLTHGDVGAAGL